MKVQEQINYERIAEAIGYIRTHFRTHPDLDELAAGLYLSPWHFQRLFTEWAGTSPKKFLQYTSIAHAKKILEQQATLFETAMETGLSGTGRLHDLFVNIEGMTPAEYRNGGRNLYIRYQFAESPFGMVLVASTGKGICHMAFCKSREEGLAALQARFPEAQYLEAEDELQRNALAIFRVHKDDLPAIKLHLKGSDFQLKVWESLLKIPMGALSTYGRIAAGIGSPDAQRAVGTAIGSNPVAYLIPCHRVIRSNGESGGYMWGPDRKMAIIGWEAAREEETV
ncbi:MAG: methylated-DNA--[protein]-cysteine S-methyltransferase [Bacteroidia bacterium]|nr:methylated-DNA--[protein]-cysteine S-methyltransferase [Bacteroidia bacterium]